MTSVGHFANSPDAIKTPVKNLMTPKPVSLSPQTLAFECLETDGESKEANISGSRG